MYFGLLRKQVKRNDIATEQANGRARTRLHYKHNTQSHREWNFVQKDKRNGREGTVKTLSE